MDQAILVENQIDDGQTLIDLLVKGGFNVTAACWLRTSEEGQWFLYIASKDVDAGGRGAGYAAMHGAIKQMTDPWLSIFEVKFIGAEEPIARDLLDLQRERQGKLPARLRRSRLGNLAVEEVYLYPPPGETSPRSTAKTKVIGRREECLDGEKRLIEEEIGIVHASPVDDAFMKAFRTMIVARFGTIEQFARKYPNGYRIEWAA